MQFYNLQTQKPTVKIQYLFLYSALKEKKGVYSDRYTEVEKRNGELTVRSKRAFRRITFTWNTPNICKDAFLLGDMFERSYGTIEWEKTQTHPYWWYFAVSNGTQTDGYGVKTGCNSFVYWTVTNDAVTLTCDCKNGDFPVKLGDRKLVLCELVALSGRKEEPFAFMQRFCGAMCPKPRLPRYPVYGNNNWYYASLQYDKMSQELMMKDADLLAEMTEGLKNRPYCVVDDGWQKKDYVWEPNERFPDLEGMVRYIKDKDMKAGVWVRLLVGNQSTPKKQRIKMTGKNVMLDPTVPEVQRHVYGLVKKLKDAGFELIKHDFSTGDLLGKLPMKVGAKNPSMPMRKFYDRSKTSAEIVLGFYRLIRKAAGNCVIIGCNTVSHLSAGIFELYRTGDDTSGTNWDRTVKMGVGAVAFRGFQHNKFYACDADCISHTGKIEWQKNRQWLELLAKSGTPLFTSVDPRLVTDEIKKDLKKAFAEAEKQECVAVPEHWFDNAAPTDWTRKTEKLHFIW